MFPVVISLETEREVRHARTAYDNQIQNCETLADELNSTPATVNARLEQARDQADEQAQLRFDDTLDADISAKVFFEEYQMAEQASVSTTFTDEEQAKIREGLGVIETICDRISAQMDGNWEALPEPREA